MTVYVINNMIIHDMEEYRNYIKAIMPVFQRFGGQVLAAQNKPVPAVGTWPYDRTVLLSFPSREAAQQWTRSPEYEEIAKYGRAGTQSHVVMLDALPQTH
jgi:uncharacterized protein (DUF1330 family)